MMFYDSWFPFVGAYLWSFSGHFYHHHYYFPYLERFGAAPVEKDTLFEIVIVTLRGTNEIVIVTPFAGSNSN